MQILVTIIAFVLIFSVLVLVHELGHFWAAKRAGIKVEEFGIGLPPRAWGKKKGETIYSINWIPFGGFVRMLGEDAHDKSMLKNPRSFIAKSKWARTKVVTAGVVMNFLLAWVLLSFGFMVGMEPLIVDSDDLSRAIQSGAIELKTGVVVKNVEQESNAEKIGFKEGDIIVGFTPKGQSKKIDYLEDVSDGTLGTYSVQRGKTKVIDFTVNESLDGLEFYPARDFPALKVVDSTHNWFPPNSYLLSLFDERLTSVEQLNEDMNSIKSAEFNFISYQENVERKIPLREVEEVSYAGVFVLDVIANSPAEKAGLKRGDRVLQVGDHMIESPSDFMKYSEENSGKSLNYVVDIKDKGAAVMQITPDEDGKVGAYLTQLLFIDAGLSGQLLVYTDVLPTSVLSIKDVQYSWYRAPFEAIREMGRLSVVTAEMFVDTVGDIVSGGGVPDNVAGPLGIASLTGDVVQDGLFATLRFIALLSLSLGVINILPFPALDGGRFLFIIIEAVTGRRVNQKWEAYIHSIGFLILMLLILVITYNDLLRFFL